MKFDISLNLYLLIYFTFQNNNRNNIYNDNDIGN